MLNQLFMKKRLMTAAFISMSLALSTSFVGCKDYDDDITEINANTSDLTNQIAELRQQLQQQATNLSEAAAQAQASADQANAAAQTAIEKGDAAMAKAQAALAAAEQAKADALSALAEQAQQQAAEIATLKSDLESLIAANQGNIANNAAAIEDIKTNMSNLVSDLAGLQGRVSALDENLTLEINSLSSQIADLLAKVGVNASDIAVLKTQFTTLDQKVGDLEKFKEATEVQLAALENFKENIQTLFDNFKGQTEKDIAALQQQADDAAQKLKDLLETTLPEIQDDITDLDERLKALEGLNLANALKELNDAVTAINNELTTVNNTLTKVNKDIQRIDGALSTLNQILSRRLSSVTFVPSAYVDGIPAIDFSSIEYVPMAKTANGNWEAGTGDAVHVASTDIKAVYRLNPSTVGLEDINVDGIEFMDGVATSRAATESSLIKVAENGASINDNGELVLNVVKTKADLFNAGLASNQINIVALKVPLASKHLFEDETEAYVYSEYVRLSEFQLTPQIGKVGVESAEPQFADSLAAYTDANVETVNVPFNTSKDLLEIVDAVLLNKGAWYMSLDTPEARATYGIDLQFHMAKAENPVKGVNQQMFGKIEGSVFTPVIPEGYSIQSIYGMTPIVAVTLVDKKNNNVIDQRYLKLNLTAEPKNYTISYPTFESELFCGTLTQAISWTEFNDYVLSMCGTSELGYLTQDEFVKYYIEEGLTPTVEYSYEPASGLTIDTDATNPIVWDVDAEQVGEVTTTKTVTAKVTFKNESRGEIVVTFSLIVTRGADQMPTLGTTDKLYWDNETMLIYPTNPIDGVKAEYNTNILDGRYAPYVNNLLDCASYYMFLTVGDDSPASLKFPTGFETPYSITSANQDDLAEENAGVHFFIENNPAGIAMVEAEETVTMNWNAYLNGADAGNLVTFGVSKLKILKPLYLSTNPSAVPLVDNSLPKSVELQDYYTVTDYYKNVVYSENEKNDQLIAFYDITSVAFGPDADILIADNVEGTDNVRQPKDINCDVTVTQDGQLTYQNKGAALVNDAYVLVPITIEHLWGKLTGYVAVPLKKAN